MRRLILVLMLAIVSSSAMAEWVEFAEDADETITVYVDPTTIRKSGSDVKMWELYDFSTAREIDGKKIMSSKVQSFWDCKADQKVTFYIASYAKSMGKGKLLESGNTGEWWSPIIPGSMDESLFKYVCGK